MTSAFPDRRGPIVHKVILDRVRFYRHEIVDALGPHYKRLGERRLEGEDAYEIRHMIEGWGQTCKVELRCPTSWWQHAKLALRERWPRIFGNLVVRFTIAVAENGAIVARLLPAVKARYWVIPYLLPTTFHERVDDPRPDPLPDLEDA